MMDLFYGLVTVLTLSLFLFWLLSPTGWRNLSKNHFEKVVVRDGKVFIYEIMREGDEWVGILIEKGKVPEVLFRSKLFGKVLNHIEKSL